MKNSLLTVKFILWKFKKEKVIEYCKISFFFYSISKKKLTLIYKKKKGYREVAMELKLVKLLLHLGIGCHGDRL